MGKILIVLGMLSAGTYIASKIASFTVRKPKPIAVFSPAQWDYYRQNWPAKPSNV